MAQPKVYEAEAKVEAKYCEKKNLDIALREINQEFESQRFQLQQANRWADQAQRDKISLYGELELRNRVFQEYHVRDCQEIEELRRICCEEKDRARQARIGELSVHQERNPPTVSQLLAQIRDVQNKVNSLSYARLPSSRSWQNSGEKLTGLECRNDLMNICSRSEVRLIQPERFGDNHVMNNGIWRASMLCW